jgi:opine dehydrogenase
LLEDIPTGILPMIELGTLCNLELPLLESILNITQALLQIDFRVSGRTLKNLALNNLSRQEFLNLV